MPMGPIELVDTVGLDVAAGVGAELAPFLGLPIPAALSTPPEPGKRGKKDGQGLYKWENGKAVKPELPKDYKVPADLEDRLILPLLNEAVACLHDGVVADADLLDAGVIFGTGFAPFRGGPIQYIREAGADVLLERLKLLQARVWRAVCAAAGLGFGRTAALSCQPDAVAMNEAAHQAASLRRLANYRRASRSSMPGLHRVRRLAPRSACPPAASRSCLSPPRLRRCRRTARRCRRGDCPARPAASPRRPCPRPAGARLILGQRQQQEHLIAEEITLGRGDEDAAVLAGTACRRCTAPPCP